MRASERHLSAVERQQLREIRKRRATRNARREIQNDQYFKGAGKFLFFFFGGALFVFWPLLVWHGQQPTTGDYTWTGATWIAMTIWWVSVGMPALLIWAAVQRSRKTAGKPPQPEAGAEPGARRKTRGELELERDPEFWRQMREEMPDDRWRV
jgi:hypothetical protein